MADPLLSLASSDLRTLASAIRAGRLIPPFDAVALQRYVSAQHAGTVVESLAVLQKLSGSSESIAHTLELLSEAVAERTSEADFIDLVMSAPATPIAANRDTSVVVSELFRNATRSVLLAGYAVHQGQKVFRELASRMNEAKDLSVRFCLDIQRKPGDTTCNQDIVRRFLYDFQQAQWPAGIRLPELFYYPASLSGDRATRAAMHAKSIVVDGLSTFISSANFTEAAQQRNIEVGIVVHSVKLADQITRFFNALVKAKELVQIC